MATQEPLELSETFRHFNTLIWQVPSWGVAIAAGVIVAANQIGKESSTWTIAPKYVQACVVFFGALLLTALAIAHYRYRAFQAASAPEPVPVPPFQRRPAANTYLQGAICLMAGGLMGLAIAQLSVLARFIVVGFAFGLAGWIWAEVAAKRIVKEIDARRSVAPATAKAYRP